MAPEARRRPRIALVTDAIFPFHLGGKETRYDEVSRRLQRYGDVHVYTMNWWQGARTMQSRGVTFHAIAPLTPLYRGDRRSIREAVVFALGCLALLFEDFDALEADHMPYMQLFSLRLVASLRRKRLVVTWHELWGPEYWRIYLGRLGVIGWWFERLALRLPDEIVAVSPGTAARLHEVLPPRIKVTSVPHGSDLAAMAAVAASAERCDLVTVGRMLPHKRLDMLLDALALLRDDGLHLTCRVIGNGGSRDDLVQQAQDLGLSDAIEFRHDVRSQEDLYALMKAASAFVFPSEREGFGAAALEALGCGLPVVTTSAPDNLAADLVRRSGRSLVCAPDARSLAAAIRRVLDVHTTAGTWEVEPWLTEFDWDTVTHSVAQALRVDGAPPAASRERTDSASR